MNVPISPPPLSPRLRLCLEFLLYAVLTAFMLHATWLTWPDTFIDFSRELYLPWRVSCGDLLYRDLAYDFGPLSVYTNAALFALLGGPSIHALFALNFAFWLSILLALRALLRRIASPLAATLAVSSFILLFSFSRYTSVGNDNYLAPYSHDLVRGFLFSLLALLSLDSAFSPLPGGTPPPPEAPSPSRFFLPGFLYALVLFSKPELAFAATVSLALLFARHIWLYRSLLLRPLLAFLLAVLSTVSLVVVPFSFALHSLPRALHDTLLNLYLDCFDSTLVSLPFYRHTTGLDAPLAHALRLLCGAFPAVLPFLLACLLPRFRSRVFRGFAIVLLAVATAAIVFFAFYPLNSALPLAPLALLAISLFRWWHTRTGTKPPALAAAFALFALALVSKITLNAGVFHYGFVLALPAFCCAVLLAFRPPLPSPRMRLAVIAVTVFAMTGVGLALRGLARLELDAPVHDNACRTDPLHATAANALLDWIRTETPPGSTLAVLPEGAILNVLSGRPNPTPYVFLTHPDILRFGSAGILDAYRTSPPDTLILLDIHEGSRFGTDYARDFMGVLDPLYSPVKTLVLPSPSGPFAAIVIATRNCR